MHTSTPSLIVAAVLGLLGSAAAHPPQLDDLVSVATTRQGGAGTAARAGSPTASPDVMELARRVDRDLRVLDRGQLTDDERKQCDEAKSLAQRARRLREANGGNEAEARSLAMEASKLVVPLVRRQLKLDALAAAATLYRSGNVAAALQAASEILASDLDAPLRYIEEHRDGIGVEGNPLADLTGKVLAARALLETELAFQGRYDAMARLGQARRLLAVAHGADLPPRTVEQWCIAVAGHLQARLRLAEAMHHVEDGVRRFPNDADLLALAGALYELIASPGTELPERSRDRTNPTAREAWQATGARISGDPHLTFASASDEEGYEKLVAARKTGLARAEECYRRALAADPNHAMAHLRLGRVLFLTARQDAALSELRLAAANADPRVRYLASMFEGAVHEAAERAEEAAASYQEAGRTCPTCLSAGIALSHVQRHLDGLGPAAQTIDAALARSALTDYWWDYPLGEFWQRDLLMNRLRGSLR